MDEKEKKLKLKQKKNDFINMLRSRNVVFDLEHESDDEIISRIIKIVPTKTSIYRTSRGLGSICNTVKDAAKKEAYSYLYKQFDEVFKKGDLTQDSYKEWFEKTCTELTKRFNESIKTSCKKKTKKYLTLGQAQKWISMVMKYIYCLDLDKFKFEYCYCPIDNIIKEKALEIRDKNGKPANLKGLGKKLCWSKIDQFDDLIKIYSDIDDIIKQNNLDCTQLEFDVLYW